MLRADQPTRARTSDYAEFRILVDDPADDPALGFADYADAFAEIVSGSPPRFAVGIFGSWGSGKTTLMRAIWARIERRSDVIPVWFNAWRYEREEHLIIPLLDVLREALLDWADEYEERPDMPASIPKRARRAAAAMGAAGRAIMAGLSVSARLPGGILQASLDLEKVLANQAGQEEGPRGPVSLYHASFMTMADAVEGFVTAEGRRRPGRQRPDPQRRIVVFVDDLDRCLPLNALSVLEAMKLFFDLEGFVFVAGLDQQVIERAIELRYADPRDRGNTKFESSTDEGDRDPSDEQRRLSSGGGVITGRDYVKKIFQVPFGLPPVDRSQLDDLVRRLVGARSLPRAQERDLSGRILSHLQYFSDESGINPREIKRLINAYTLQTKLLSLKLGEVDRDSVLALQVMAFRPDWERIWKRLEADPEGFMDRLNQGLKDASAADTVWVEGEPLPPRLVDYIKKGPAKPLLANKKIKAYLSSSQASHSSDPLVLQAQAAVDALTRLLRGINDTTDRANLSASLHGELDALNSAISKVSWGQELKPLFSRLEADATALTQADPDRAPPAITEWSQGFRARLDRLDNDLRELRDRYSLRD
jgi:hypothetical protein